MKNAQSIPTTFSAGITKAADLTGAKQQVTNFKSGKTPGVRLGRTRLLFDENLVDQEFEAEYTGNAGAFPAFAGSNDMVLKAELEIKFVDKAGKPSLVKKYVTCYEAQAEIEEDGTWRMKHGQGEQWLVRYGIAPLDNGNKVPFFSFVEQ